MRTEMAIGSIEKRTDDRGQHFRLRATSDGHAPPVHCVFSWGQAMADGAFRHEVFAIVMAFESFAAHQVAVEVTWAGVNDRDPE